MTEPTRVSPKDVFLDLWTVVTLYVSVGFFISLLFDYVNYFFPDVANPYFSSDSVRWSVAILLAIFPTHIVAQWWLQKGYMIDPEKRERRLRKWLLYLTLFLTAVILVGDLVALVYNFLGGELSARFILKVLSVGVVAGGVLSYYILDLRREGVKLAFESLVLVRGLITIVLIAVVGAFFITGSPFRQRDIKIDEQRIGALSTIQNQIVFTYWQNKGGLPPTLDALRDSISGFVPPVDPETNNPYEYAKIGDLSFQLCAVFITSNINDPKAKLPQAISYPPYGAPDNWQHAAGRVCFDRTIDPSLYSKQQTTPSLEPMPAKPVR